MTSYLRFVFLLFILPTISFAQGVNSAGMPCFKDICVGDGLSVLKNIKWKEATNIIGKPLTATKLSVDEKNNAVKQLRGSSVNSASVYWHSDVFDTNGLTYLGALSAICSMHSPAGSLSGKFISEGGHETAVYIAPVAIAGSPTLELKVVRITRTYPAGLSRTQIESLQRQVAETYKGLDVQAANLGMTSSDDINKPVIGFDSLNLLTGRQTVGLNSPSKWTKNHADQLRGQPLCGGNSPVKLD